MFTFSQPQDNEKTGSLSAVASVDKGAQSKVERRRERAHGHHHQVGSPAEQQLRGGGGSRRCHLRRLRKEVDLTPKLVVPPDTCSAADSARRTLG